MREGTQGTRERWRTRSFDDGDDCDDESGDDDDDDDDCDVDDGDDDDGDDDDGDDDDDDGEDDEDDDDEDEELVLWSLQSILQEICYMSNIWMIAYITHFMRLLMQSINVMWR